MILEDGEKENPFVTPSRKKIVPHGDEMELDELAEDVKPTPRKRGHKAGTAPAKHGASESCIAPSPAKISTHIPPSKRLSCDEEIPVQIATPQTPRHRDTLSKKVVVTPRHRHVLVGRPLTPRTPRTPSTPRNAAPTIYNDARQLFTKASGELVGRENQRKELHEFVSTRTKAGKPGYIYVSGPPGTGKSTLVRDVCRSLESEGSVRTAHINCLGVHNTNGLFRAILEGFVDISEIPEGEEIAALKNLFTTRDYSYVLTLDEIDGIADFDLQPLYDFFELSHDPSSSLILVGIANTLDFTGSFLQKLKARGFDPQLLPFLAYTAPQIASVINSRLKSLLPATSTKPADFVPFMHPTAVLFLSKKVASQGADLRKALDICRRVMEVLEAEARDQQAKIASELTPSPTPSPSKTPLVENMNLSSPPVFRSPSKVIHHNTVATSLPLITVENAPRATIAHVARITAIIFSNTIQQRLQNLNLQQKAVLCSLAALEKKSTPETILSSRAPTIKAVFEAYTSLCGREKLLHPLTSMEFRDVVASLEAATLISAVGGKAGSLDVKAATPSKRGRAKFGGDSIEERTISSSVKDTELLCSLVGPGCGILKGIMNGEQSV